jgi:LPXTG-site transpeptidase (sortase) family protein
LVATSLLAVLLSGGTVSAWHDAADTTAVATPHITAAPSGDLQPAPRGPGADASAAPRPVRLEIPAIAVDTALVPLGLNADGSLQVPTDYSTAGWYVFGPAPGERGPAVIAGHVDSVRGSAVFYELRRLHRGDVFRVGRADGSRATFSVQRVEQVPKTSFPTHEVFGPVAGSELRLITCGGPFDRQRHSYRDNVVVFARLEPA